MIKIEPKKNLIPSSLCSDEKIARSYLPVAKGLKILAIAIKNAASPKSDGEYILDIANTANNEIIWETRVPPDRVVIFFIYSDDFIELTQPYHY